MSHHSNLPPANAIVRATFRMDRIVNLYFKDDAIPHNHAAVFANYGRSQVEVITTPYLHIECRSKRLASACEQMALKLTPNCYELQRK